jgi:hypothetical protein
MRCDLHGTLRTSVTLAWTTALVSLLDKEMEPSGLADSQAGGFVTVRVRGLKAILDGTVEGTHSLSFFQCVSAWLEVGPGESGCMWNCCMRSCRPWARGPSAENQDDPEWSVDLRGACAKPSAALSCFRTGMVVWQVGGKSNQAPGRFASGSTG